MDSIFKAKHSSGYPRRLIGEHSGTEFCSNTVTNSKYTLLTFLPMNLFEQFHRPLNLYFLIVALLQFIPSIAPVSPLSTVGPLLVAFSITAAKEGYDDMLRHRQDRVDNNRIYRRINRATFSEENVVCKDICVGDILLLGQYDMLPCDAVALMSSNGDGTVYVSTENLDGESDAKEKIAALCDRWRASRNMDVAQARFEVLDEKEALNFLNANKDLTIDSEGPDHNLDCFNGTLHSDAGLIGLNADHYLPATSVVRNTQLVLAIAIFTGNETKVGLTKRFPPIKWALLDRECSKYAKSVFVLQFVLVALFSVIGGFVLKDSGPNHWYLRYDVEPEAESFYVLILPLRYFLMATLMVPISFKVTVDVSKAYVSLIMQWDHGTYDETSKSFCKVNNSALAEDLGQVEYMLTDKTGTLTENKMNFRSLMTAEGHIHSGDDGTLTAVADAASRNESTYRLVECLLLCNTVEKVDRRSSREDSSMVVHSSSWTSPSPDEVALVEGASQCGATLLDRTRQTATALVGGEERSYEVLYVIKFSSSRGRMSVLLRDAAGNHILLCKGSDERLLPLCKDISIDRAMISRRLSDFASKGLRTLAYGYRQLSQDVVQLWLTQIRDVETDPDQINKTKRAVEAYGYLERELHFAGITAVEDELQPQVKETILKLRQASVKVWMLTGDKLETARQIATTSGLLAQNDTVFDFVPPANKSSSDAEHIQHVAQCISDLELRNKTVSIYEPEPIPVSNHFNTASEISKEFTRPDEVSSQFLDSVARLGSRKHSLKEGSSRSMKSEETLGLLQRDKETPQSEEYSIVVSGKTLALLNTPEHEITFAKFKDVLLGASTVICCRTTPDQKASVVNIVKSAGKMTLAIGDGGNDVAMIQEAHVGVGVEGVEGRQASKASDFSIGRFSYVSRLILVHGHTAFQRTAYIVQLSFYKSMIIAWVQLLFNIYTLFSGVSFWNSFALTMWNGLFTIPLTFLYVTDVQLQPNVLMSIPSLFQISQKARYLNSTTFFVFVVRGMVQGTIAFFISCACLGPDIPIGSGRTTDYQTQFISPYGGAVALVAFTTLMEAHSFFFLQWVALIGSIAAFVVSFYAYSEYFVDLDFYGAYNMLLSNPAYYATTLCVFAACLLPHCLFSGMKFWYWPSRLQLQRGFAKRISMLPSHNLLREQFPEDNPSTLLGSMYPSGCSEKAEVAPSHSVKPA